MENKNVWIKRYKILIYLSVIAILLAGFVMGANAADSYRGDFGDFLKYFAPAVFAAAVDLVLGMLIATFFENVQIIRDKLERM